MRRIDLTAAPPSGGLIAAAAAQANPRASERAAPRIGIVCMTKQPIAFHTWLTYHHEVCGIERFFLRVEDTPGLGTLLASSPWNTVVEAEFSSGPRDYFVQMDRQNRHIEAAMPRARAHGLDFLLHIDDDECALCAMSATPVTSTSFLSTHTHHHSPSHTSRLTLPQP